MHCSASDAVVQILCVGSPVDWTHPWQVEDQEEWSGSGFQVEHGGNKYIVTNAHVVANAKIIRGTQESTFGKDLLEVCAIAPDIDLALLEYQEQGRAALSSLTLAAEIQSPNSNIIVIGYPEGGANICFTKGIISRLDAQQYAYPMSLGLKEDSLLSPAKVLLLQTDAAINSGNSGGPTLNDQGEVVGAASSSMQSTQCVGYVIPSLIINLFLATVSDGSAWPGVPELGFTYRFLEDPTERSFRKLKSTGVLITSVAPLSPNKDVLRAGDIIQKLGEHQISNEGTVIMNSSCGWKAELSFEHLITMTFDKMVCHIWRDERDTTASLEFKSIPPILPRYAGIDAFPTYACFGGLVFCRLSVPLLDKLREEISDDRLASLDNLASDWKRSSDGDIPILLCILRHSINAGCSSTILYRKVIMVDDNPIHSLECFVQACREKIHKEPNGLLRFGFEMMKHQQIHDEICLPIKFVTEAESEILDTHAMHSSFSCDLLDIDGSSGAFRKFMGRCWTRVFSNLSSPSSKRKWIRTQARVLDRAGNW